MSNPVDKKTAGVAGVTLAVGLALGLLAGGGESVTVSVDPTAQTQRVAEANVQLATVQPCGSFDVQAYSREVSKLRSSDPSLVDLLSPCVQPGQRITTGAGLDRGARLTNVMPLGDESAFALDAQFACADQDKGTWCEVTATNLSGKPQRLMAVVRWVKQ